jgi:hypothetical protein
MRDVILCRAMSYLTKQSPVSLKTKDMWSRRCECLSPDERMKYSLQLGNRSCFWTMGI